MPGFIEDQDLLDSMSTILKPEEFGGSPSSVLPSWVWQAIKDANVTAYGSILSILARRGFNASQIGAWYRGPEIQRDVGCYFCCMRLIAANQLAATMADIKPMDRRQELLTMDITDGSGNLILPTLPSSGPGLFTSGVIAIAPNETFRASYVQRTPCNPWQFKWGF